MPKLVLAVAALLLAGCMARQTVSTNPPSGITSNNGGGDRTLGNVGVGGPIAVTRTQ